ncbi:alpha/beta hydrolase family protein [Pseudonocardia sp. CA-142604]|uniref:alpha/beta hydrolase family protein n=1 Tax=Pseudonocardia sp. CA-142604 TaxID=3240024 RepID=UPI003D92D245
MGLRRGLVALGAGAALLTALMGTAAWSATPAAAATREGAPAQAEPAIREIQLSIPTSDGLVLPATLRVPADARPQLPGMVLVHGAGPGPREKYRAEAEAFARAGIATLAYDKRTAGYSLLERSYSRLADDAIAAADLLRGRPEVDPDAVGFWGFSEGGWVAPLAAKRAPQTAFLVVVGANGVAPLRQQIWADTIKMEHAGVTGSLVETHARTPYRVLAAMGLFPEPYFDPGPALRSLSLPVLGIWGAQDRLTPPVESVTAYRTTLDEAGNSHYTLRTVEGAEHGLRITTTGFDKGTTFAPGYIDLVTSWVTDAAGGRPPATSVAGVGEQPRPTAAVPPPYWYESAWVQVGAPTVLVLGFAGFGLTAAWRRLRGRPVMRSSWPAGVLAGAGLTTVVGTFTYLGYLQVSAGRTVAVGPMLAGRPLVWLALQALAVVTVIAATMVAVRWRAAAAGAGRTRVAVLLATGAVFVPWAAFWGLLAP